MSIGAQSFFLSNDVQAKWLNEDSPSRMQLAPIFPFLRITGHELRYADTPALTPGVAIDFCGVVPENTNLPVQPNRTFRLKELANGFRVCESAEDIASANVNPSQVGVQIPLSIRGILYKYWTLFESGDSTLNPAEFDGLNKLVDPTQVTDLACSELTLEALIAQKEKVRTNNGRDVSIFTNSIGKQAILAAHWVRGLEPKYQDMAVPSAMGGTRIEKVLTFDGSIVYVNDLNQTFNCGSNVLGTNIWFFVMGENNLHGIMPASLGSSMFVVRSVILPDASTLVYRISMPTGLALGSKLALSVIKRATIPT